jgi:hypothetical protein
MMVKLTQFHSPPHTHSATTVDTQHYTPLLLRKYHLRVPPPLHIFPIHGLDVRLITYDKSLNNNTCDECVWKAGWEVAKELSQGACCLQG